MQTVTDVNKYIIYIEVLYAITYTTTISEKTMHILVPSHTTLTSTTLPWKLN
jgi:hypothetical protein